MADYNYTAERQMSITEVPLFWGFTAWDVLGVVEVYVVHEDEVRYYSDGSGYPGYDGATIEAALTVEEYVLTHKWLPEWAVDFAERLFLKKIETWLLEALEGGDIEDVDLD
jgi:hypothetical protein